MSDRYYLSNDPIDRRATIDGTEAHHLLHVMRSRTGDTVTLFDGNGGEYSAVVEECGRREVVLAVGERQLVSRELPIEITLGVALPKGDRQKWLVEKLTELGVATLVPLTTERSVADLKGKSLERLQRAVIEASKQCRRNQLMRIAPPQPLPDLLASATGTKLVAHPSGEPIATVPLATCNQACIVIGPEGGLTDAEVELSIEHHWQAVSLGPSILRIETAALAMAAMVANTVS